MLGFVIVFLTILSLSSFVFLVSSSIFAPRGSVQWHEIGPGADESDFTTGFVVPKRRTQDHRGPPAFIFPDGWPSNHVNDSGVSCNTFPRVIHQTWKDGKTMPIRFKQWMASWFEHQPEWRHVLYDDRALEALVAEHFPEWLAKYKRLRGVEKADLGRMLVVFVRGGVYVDVDFESIKSLGPLLDEAEKRCRGVILSEETLVHSYLLERHSEQDRPFVSNAFIAAAPEQPFVKAFLHRVLDKRLRKGLPTYRDPVTSGSRELTKLVHEVLKVNDGSLGSIWVLPFNVMFPEICQWNVGAMREKCVGDRPVHSLRDMEWAIKGCPMLAAAMANTSAFFDDTTLAVHHWQCSWCPGREHSARDETFVVAAELPDMRVA
ncbi:unnamed protein product [Vitrella brassicaformis CCMP3155]|uniref:Alpha 1,4-glycosyltransferase domain-containing protein n=2 Tax=Vitrella brassicaformis TaxID=1169539 RepID=A0A0G4FBJ3_VITBC|nr:unnamed protein product [Vitrella brassicaformis CCMP3155]|eukprot:CEM10235.1 unnamed protein product [Vitrella brassicaformis CCMP3155]